MGSSAMRGWLWLLFCLCVIKKNTSDVMTFSKYNYPNPWTNSTACGRPGPSNVCDPGGYLNVTEVDLLDGIIGSIEELKECPCPKCNSPKDPYVKVQIAVVPSITGNFSSKSEKVKATRDFARYLESEIGHSSQGSCRNGVFVVLAIVQRQVYTISGLVTKNEGLDDDSIQSIFDANAEFFTRKDYGAGLAALVKQYRRVLSNDESSGETGINDGYIALIFIAVVVGLGVILYGGGCFGDGGCGGGGGFRRGGGGGFRRSRVRRGIGAGGGGGRRGFGGDGDGETEDCGSARDFGGGEGGGGGGVFGGIFGGDGGLGGGGGFGGDGDGGGGSGGGDCGGGGGGGGDGGGS